MTNAVVPVTITPADLTALLQQSGMMSKGSEFHRMTLDGGKLVTDEDSFFFNEKKPDIPACTVRIVKPPIYYSALWVDEADAATLGRPDLARHFVKKFDDPQEDEYGAHEPETYDLVTRGLGKKGSFKGDIQLQVVPESGELTGEEPVYTLTLPTTSIFEWRGSTRDPNGGSATETNFMYKLAQLAATQAAEAGADETAQKTAIIAALTSLRLGGVVADIRLWPMKSDDKSRSWTVISFTPVHIEPVTQQTALPSGNDEDLPL